MQKKPLKLLLKILIFTILGLVLLGPSFAQTESQKAATEAAPTEEVQEEHDTKNLNNLLKNYNKDAEKVLKDAEKMYPKEGAGNPDELTDKDLGEGKVLDPDDESSNETKNRMGTFDPELLKKKKGQKKDEKTHYGEEIRKTLIPFQSKSEAELLQFLKESLQGTKAGPYLDRFPKISVFTVKLVKDNEALPRFVSIADDQQKLIRFGGTMLVTVLFGMLLKRLMKKEGRSILMAISLWFLRFCIINSLRLGIIYYFYGEELKPIFQLGMSTFF